MMIGNYRPGVYSEYTVSSPYRGRKAQTAVGAVGCFGLTRSLEAVGITARDPLPQGANGLLEGLWGVVQAAGVETLWCVSLPENPTKEQVQAGLAALDAAEVYAVACQYFDDGSAQAAADWATTQAKGQKERLVVLGGADGAALMALAKTLNSERAALTMGAPTAGTGADPLYGAAALAAAIAVAEDPTVSFSNLELPGLGETAALTVSDCEELLEAGVSPLLTVADHVECLRAVTTRTRDGEAVDRTLYPLNAILIIDWVLGRLRQTLGSLLKGAKNGGGTLSAVASQVTVLLNDLKEQGIITRFGPPSVYTPGDDPGRCVVEVSFGATYTINQILIKAQVQL